MCFQNATLNLYTNQAIFCMTSFEIKADAPLEYAEQFIIRSYHVDAKRKLSIQNLCNFFQDIAGNHTVACGVGWEVMQQEKLFWALSRLKIAVKTYPVWRDQLTIKTWSNGLEGLLAVRHFQVLSADGEELIKAISMWLMVNTETRRLVRPDGYMRDFPLNPKRLFAESPGKIDPLNQAISFPPQAVSYTETDMNMHMNNVSYIDRIINSYDDQFLGENQIVDFEINFMKEAKPGQLLHVQQEKVSADTYLNNIVLHESETEMIRTRIKWEPVH